MKEFIRKYAKTLIIADCLVVYFALLCAVSFVRAPAQYVPAPDTDTLVRYRDFAVTAGESDAYVSENSLVLKESGDSVKVFSAVVYPREMNQLTVDFTVNCPEQYAGTVLHIDLYADGYDTDAQEFTVALVAGENRVSNVIHTGENAPEQAHFRIFTLDPAGYEITDLKVFRGVVKDYSASIFAALVVVLVGILLLVAIAAVCNMLHYFDPRRMLTLFKAVRWDKLQAVVFAVVIFLPGILFVGSIVLQKDLDVALGGYFDDAQRPEYSWSKAASGEFQEEFETWWNESYGLRGVIIKTYNQISYSLFREGNRPIGKDGYIFEDEYIYSELGALQRYNCSLESNREAVRQYVETIVSVSDKLERIGKKLIVYTSASKATFFRDMIPWRMLEATENDRGMNPITYFRELVTEEQFTYLDSYELLSGQEEWPVFYRTGIHWSRPAEQVVTKAIMEEIRESTNYNVSELQLQELNVSAQPFWRDSDVYDLQNIWIGKKDSAYYEYRVSTVASQSQYRPVNILLQGGSFADGFRKDFVEYSLGGNIDYVNYCTYVQNNGGPITPISSFSDLDMQSMLDTADVVVVEVNESKIMQQSDGFFAYLDAFLDSYTPQRDTTTNVDLAAKDTINTAALQGFYHLEESYVWAQKTSSVTLQDPAIGQRGLELHITIPAEVAGTANGELRVFVNGSLAYVKPLVESGEFSMVIDVQDIPATDNKYIVEFLSDGSFNPAQLGMSGDSRDLSFAVHYIGARR